jgi:hypothetical protein
MKYLLAILLLSFSTVLSAQTVDSTGNLIDPTKWGNVIPMNAGQLAQVEGEGGGPIPAYNTDTNTIRFSFMPYTVSQIIAINTALSGQGISVGGFNYSWKIYNDLTNCCGTRGTLFGNVSLFNKGGNLLESYNYDYSLVNTGAAFQTFSGTENFNNPYQLNSLGDISISWTGKDMNFWSGYYGPRVRETSLSLNYTVSQPPPTTTSTTNTTTNTVNEIIAQAAEPVTNTTTTPATTTTEPTVTTASVSTSSNPTSTTATKEESAVVKEITISGPSLSSILANIRSNQDRQNNIAMAAVASSIEVANSVTQKAEQTAMAIANASAQQALQTAVDSSTMSSANKSTVDMSIAENKQIQSASNNQTNVMQGSNNNSVVFDLLARPESKNVTVSTVAMIDYSLRPQSNVVTSTYVPPMLSLARPESRQSETVVDNQFITPEIRPIPRQSAIELLNNNNNSISTNTLVFGRKGDPIQDYIEANNSLFNEMKEESKPTVARTNIQDNELAGGIRIERLAVVPNGFSAYSQFILTNIAFYEPKEIYKNNVPKDNVRSMYFLEKGNTDTYNKMIEGQYK